MLTIEDLRNPKRNSGFDRVMLRTAAVSLGNRDRYCARKDSGHGKKPDFLGPSRATAEEAAQDWCDYINSGGQAYNAKLKSAGHTGRRDEILRDPEVEAALGVLRDAKGEREGKQGYVYCVAENTPSQTLVKVGFSTNPYARLPELQTGNGRPLILVGCLKGDRAVEASLHARYSHLNELGEWFRIDPALLAEFKDPKEVLE